MSVVIIVADSLRHDVLGYAGGPTHTPFIDRVVAESVSYSRVLSAAPWTVPSLASMFTGIYAHRLGLVQWEQPFPQDIHTLFNAAHAAGWDVASFVFDPRYLLSGVPSAGVRGSSQDLPKLLAWLRRKKGTDRPYLLFIHYWWTHIPYLAQPMDNRAWNLLKNKVFLGLRGSAASRRGVVGLYHRAVEFFSEEWLPKVIDELELDSTWLLLTADHGESWGERSETEQPRDVFDLHGNTLYDEVLRVPLVIRPPGGVAGRQVDDLVRTVDIMPTLTTALSWGKPRKNIDGKPLPGLNSSRVFPSAPHFGVQAQAVSVMNRDFVRAEHLPSSSRELWNGLALTSERWKLIWEPGSGRRQAFDLVGDPGETRNISDEKNSVLAEGWSLLERELDRARVGPAAAATGLRTRLRALGYLDDEG